MSLILFCEEIAAPSLLFTFWLDIVLLPRVMFAFGWRVLWWKQTHNICNLCQTVEFLYELYRISPSAHLWVPLFSCLNFFVLGSGSTAQNGAYKGGWALPSPERSHHSGNFGLGVENAAATSLPMHSWKIKTDAGNVMGSSRVTTASNLEKAKKRWRNCPKNFGCCFTMSCHV